MCPTQLDPLKRLQEGRYEILETIGCGGMGCIYRATDHKENRVVALKQSLFSSDTEDFEKKRELFEQEAELLTALDHPGLPKVYDHFLEEEGQYLVMDFIEGPDLGKVLDIGFVFSPDMVLELASQLLQITEYLHSRNPQVFHRDIKPQNVKVSKGGQVFLLDFGVAKDVGKGTILRGHSPFYSPPELFQGLKTDARGDLYSVGATLYHLGTGKKPADSIRERARALERGQTDPLRSLLELNRNVPPGVADILHKAMALNPDERPSSAKVMLESLHLEWSKAMLEKTIVSSRALAVTIVDRKGAQSNESIVQRVKRVSADKILKFWSGTIVVTYSPSIIISPTNVRAESLRLEATSIYDHTVVITDLDYDPVDQVGQVYVSQVCSGSTSPKRVDLPLENLPESFRLYVVRGSEEDWERADIVRQKGVVKW